MNLFNVVERATGKVLRSTDDKQAAKGFRDLLVKQHAPDLHREHGEARLVLTHTAKSLASKLLVTESQAELLLSDAHVVMRKPQPFVITKGQNHWKNWSNNAKVGYCEGMSIPESKFLQSSSR